jgi:hypothetical protein
LADRRSCRFRRGSVLAVEAVAVGQGTDAKHCRLSIAECRLKSLLFGRKVNSENLQEICSLQQSATSAICNLQ